MSMRRQSRVECDIIFNKFENKGMNICRATDISLSGMKMQKLLDPLIETAGKFRLELELPGDSEPLVIGARKIWDESGFMGVRFTNISHRHFVRLRNWVNSNDIGAQLPVFS